MAPAPTASCNPLLLDQLPEEEEEGHRYQRPQQQQQNESHHKQEQGQGRQGQQQAAAAPATSCSQHVQLPDWVLEASDGEQEEAEGDGEGQGQGQGCMQGRVSSRKPRATRDGSCRNSQVPLLPGREMMQASSDHGEQQEEGGGDEEGEEQGCRRGRRASPRRPRRTSDGTRVRSAVEEGAPQATQDLAAARGTSAPPQPLRSWIMTPATMMMPALGSAANPVSPFAPEAQQGCPYTSHHGSGSNSGGGGRGSRSGSPARGSAGRVHSSRSFSVGSRRRSILDGVLARHISGELESVPCPRAAA